jgi:hypothetical protein
MGAPLVTAFLIGGWFDALLAPDWLVRLRDDPNRRVCVPT